MSDFACPATGPARVSPLPNPRSIVELEASEAARRANVERPLDPQLDDTESRPAPMLPTTPGRRQAALALLHAHRDAMVRERTTRIHLITLARGYGLTNQEIGDALGMTEGGIRQTIRRSTGGR